MSIKRTWHIKRTIRGTWRVLCYPLLFLGVQLIVAVIWGVAVGLSVACAETSNPLNEINTIMILLVSSLLTLLILWLILKKEWKRIKFWTFSKMSICLFFLCLLLGFPFNLFMGGMIYFTRLTELTPRYHEMMSNIAGNNLFHEIIVIVILAPILEEIIFRGTILRRLMETSMKTRFVVLLQAILFGAVHLNIVQGIYTFVIGILLGIIYIRHKSIWAVIIIHSTFNLFAVLIANLSTIEMNEYTTTSNGALALVTIIAFILSAAAVFGIIKSKGRQEINRL